MRFEGSQAATISAQRQTLPTLNALTSTGQSAFSDKNGKWWYGACGVISIPLFTGGRIESEIREAQAIQRTTEARLRGACQVNCVTELWVRLLALDLLREWRIG